VNRFPTGFLAFALLLPVSACRARAPAAPEPRVVEDTVIQPHEIPRELTVTFESESGARTSFRLEIADTPELRQRGLMFRRSLAPDRGMLFVFPYEAEQAFYMKNTYVPLDMVFVTSDNRVLGVVEDARPLTLDVRGVDGLSRYVIELNAFTAKAKGIGPGTRVTFDPPPPASS
jgi:uncharacterized protein